MQLGLGLPRLRGVSAAKPDPSLTGAQCPCPELCPLNKVEAGRSVRIKRLEAGPEVSHRLREMGFCEDQHVRLLRQEESVICQVCNVRLGISAKLAETILVEPLPGRSKAA